jgi:hypothetical protein
MIISIQENVNIGYYFCKPLKGLHNKGWDNCYWCLGGSER